MILWQTTATSQQGTVEALEVDDVNMWLGRINAGGSVQSVTHCYRCLVTAVWSVWSACPRYLAARFPQRPLCTLVLMSSVYVHMLIQSSGAVGDGNTANKQEITAMSETEVSTAYFIFSCGLISSCT